ncbi:hypothetical protein BALCAV_0222360 [Alkalihalobacillus alcalophilus ATCC 27647 = CGMCC 1.3604]|uniref:Uncharacterized protein n=1 Tax=Alkalihalobacillus alcalophilus ATCC 27647 = CGMCC 1.3604 TaxID=1218173 RepID=A0A094WFD4_ALKAL|nr:hypothetical protein BALCAV_0222360 [Alkalihalobacillus alcalophilus ATCC 27647 = CGMCC 1.3604]
MKNGVGLFAMSLDNGLRIVWGKSFFSCSFDYLKSLSPQFLFELLTRRLFPLATHAGSSGFQAAHGSGCVLIREGD